MKKRMHPMAMFIQQMNRGKIKSGLSDIDGDGVPNWRDCQPLNPFRQHPFKSDEERKAAMAKIMGKKIERGKIFGKQEIKYRKELGIKPHKPPRPKIPKLSEIPYKDIDYLVRPITKKLNEKGYITYNSCQGHSKNIMLPPGPGKKPIPHQECPQITYHYDKKLDVALHKAGLVTKEIWPDGTATAVAPERISKTLKQRRSLWARVDREINKLPNKRRRK